MRIDGPSSHFHASGELPESGATSGDDAATLLDLIQDESWFDRQWLAYDAAFPGNEQLWQVRLRRLLKRGEIEAAVALIDARDFGDVHDPAAAMAKAEWLFLARQSGRATQIYEDLLALDPESLDVRLGYAKRLFTNGLLVRAHRLLGAVADRLDPKHGQPLWQSVTTTLALLTELEGGPPNPDQDCRILAMKHAVLHFRGRTPRDRSARDLGRLSLITGSVGPGGAERQLTRLAVELESARRERGSVGAHSLSRPIEIVVRTHGPEQQHDFYLQDVRDGEVEIHQIDQMKPVTHQRIGVSDPTLKTLLDYLPPSVNFGVRRLTNHFIEGGTDVASIWQDGACLFAGLPALLACVPNIQLSIRGLPPSVRKHMFRPEYEILYRAMAEVPGVTFVSNNHAAAHAYADWLGIARDRFSVVYNGVPPMVADGTEECVGKWREFEARTVDAEQTVGGVFRFDTDKQPNLWVRFAARYLKRHPKSRFVLVGGGRLLGGARDLAEELGIADRILFTDRSVCVGYWMSKMDALVLLSRYEGLPNVLIEAQHMGVRIVTTPAGGARECLIEGVTGHVLDCCEKPDLDQIVEFAHSLAASSADPSLFRPGGVAHEFLHHNFSIPNMLASYVACTVGANPEPQSDKVSRQAA